MENNRVGTRELKSKLSAYLRRVKEGESIIVTEHGRPIGQITPLEPGLEGRIQALMDAGLITWNRKSFRPRRPAAANSSRRQVSDLVEEDRSIDPLS